MYISNPTLLLILNPSLPEDLVDFIYYNIMMKANSTNKKWVLLSFLLVCVLTCGNLQPVIGQSQVRFFNAFEDKGISGNSLSPSELRYSPADTEALFPGKADSSITYENTGIPKAKYIYIWEGKDDEQGTWEYKI